MDEAHEETERLLKELEEKIASEYKQAAEEVQAKLDDYLRRFAIKDKIKRQQLANGEITKEYYDYWRTGQILVGQRWEEMRDTLAADYHNANAIATSIINQYMPEVYAINHNYATFEVESGSLIDTSYTLYDRQTVERLLRDNPDMLPPPGKKISAAIAKNKDLRWNNQQIQSVMLQSILQGESIPKIAERLATTVGDSNYKSAVRNARTMATGAQNAGRVDGYKRAESKGIDLMQEWSATLDSRTRHTHRQLDGERIKVGGTFSNGCRFPGDPRGDPSEVYNCRCTLIAQIKGFEIEQSKTSSKLGDMTYDEWKNEHKRKGN